jgi:hypothetical protein
MFPSTLRVMTVALNFPPPQLAVAGFFSCFCVSVSRRAFLLGFLLSGLLSSF